MPFGEGVLVPAIVPAGRRALALPKGHLEPGESPDVAAGREVFEETGVRGVVVGDLGSIDYRYRGRRGELVHKVVDWFLLRYAAGRPGRHDAEVERVALMSLPELARALTYRGEREVVARAVAILEDSGGYPRMAANGWRVHPHHPPTQDG
jgi:8-oxo-dGTP pyrophosphatase MutT (NUDIX family)